METTFSKFSGNAPIVKTSCKRNINFKKLKIKNIMKYQYLQMRRKIIDD